jgi:hypothetical protein
MLNVRDLLGQKAVSIPLTLVALHLRRADTGCETSSVPAFLVNGEIMTKLGHDHFLSNPVQSMHGPTLLAFCIIYMQRR